jgi:hypothetical protein
MTLDLSTIQNQITEIQNMISSFDVSEREKLELQELREEAAQEGGAGNFMAPTPDGFKTGDRYFQNLVCTSEVGKSIGTGGITTKNRPSRTPQPRRSQT